MGSYLLYACSNWILGVHWGDMWEIFYKRIYPWKIELLGDQRGFDSLLAYFLDISVSDDYFLIVRLAFQKMFQGSKGYWYHPSLFGPLHKYVLFFLSLALIRCNYNSHYETITCCSGGCITISVIVDLEAADWINNKHKVSISLTTKAQSVSFHTARQMSRFPHLHPLCLICIRSRDPVVQSHNSSIL